MTASDQDFPCDHGRVCLIECPDCSERRKREDAIARRSRFRVIEGDGFSTKQFRETLEILKQVAADLRDA